MASLNESTRQEGAALLLPPSHTDNASGPSPLWDNKEVASFLNVKESTIRNWVHIGYIPHVKFRGAVRFQKAAIVKWVEECAVSSDSRDAGMLSRNILRLHNRR